MQLVYQEMVLYQTSKESLRAFQKLISCILITSLSFSSLETRDHIVSLEKSLGQICCTQSSSMEESLNSANNCCHLKIASVCFKLCYHYMCPSLELLVLMKQKEKKNYVDRKKMLKIIEYSKQSHLFILTWHFLRNNQNTDCLFLNNLFGINIELYQFY